jgi:hypothetical protein
MQIRLAIAVVLFCAWSALALYIGHQWGRADGADRAAKLLSKQMDAVLAEQAEDRKRAEKLQRTLDRLPKSEGKVREIVRDNPSGCVLPPAVVDGLREAIRSANSARALPADS